MWDFTPQTAIGESDREVKIRDQHLIDDSILDGNYLPLWAMSLFD